MALTQSARAMQPSWDEEVVPALRQRLQHESQDLARLMSSIQDGGRNGAGVNGSYGYGDSSNRADGQRAPAKASSSSQKSPVHGHGASRLNGTTTSTKPSSSLRTRTYSSPLSSDLPRTNVNGQTNGKQKAQLSQNFSSPAKPTRIPIPASRSRSASNTLRTALNSSSPPAPLSNSTNQPYTQRGQVPESLTIPGRMDGGPSSPARSTTSINSQQSPGLLHEQPPFQAGSSNEHSMQSHDNFDDFPARPSMESEDVPFEHWYRGDLSRSGGVGEMKVGKRKQMLDIAQYGHQIRQAPNELLEERRGRKRADSIGGIGKKERESFYMEDPRDHHTVLDEDPLTDFDGEHSQSEYEDNAMDYDEWIARQRDTSQSTYNDGRSTTPTASQPLYNRQNSAPPGSSTSSHDQHYNRGQSEPPNQPPSSSSNGPGHGNAIRKPQQRSASGPLPGSEPGSAKKRAASPGNAIPSSAKKAKDAAAKATRDRLGASKKDADTNNNRRSIAQYPSLDDGLENAIPTWTQPVRKDGNWDDVVLPVVAKKKGLVDVIEQADGTPQKRVVEERIEPAPGTFGWDHSKYKPPRNDDYTQNEIQMDEFGQPRAHYAEEDMEPPATPRAITTPYDEVPVGKAGRTLSIAQPPSLHKPTQPPDAPFAQYAPTSPPQTVVKTGAPPLGKMEVGLPKLQEEEEAAGCCKCIIM